MAILTRLGRSIPIKKMAKDAPGFEAEVDRIHAMVITELQVGLSTAAAHC